MATIRLRWDIEVMSSKEVMGGYLTTTKPMTVTECKSYMKNLIKENLYNNPTMNSLSYIAWEEDPNDDKDVDKMQNIYVSATRIGKKIKFYVDSH